jgi:uncharacterized membrane protein
MVSLEGTMQRIEKSIRVAAPASRVYELWRNFENFPRFMEHVEEVHTLGDGQLSHWKLKAPLGVNVEYDAKIAEDVPNKSIGWRSTDGNLGNSGNVTFTETDDRMTLVHVVMQWFDPPAGPIGEALSHILQNPDKMLDEDLRRFKDWAETGQSDVSTRVA